jgi:hypothetical protein
MNIVVFEPITAKSSWNFWRQSVALAALILKYPINEKMAALNDW